LLQILMVEPFGFLKVEFCAGFADSVKRKFLNKFNLIYNGIKGAGNELTRLFHGFAQPKYVEFCLCYYGGLISTCTTTSIDKYSGDNQSGFKNEELLLPLVVSVQTIADDGTEISRSAYQKVKFEVVSGGGSVNGEIVNTNPQTGTAETYWTLGDSGEQKVKAVVVDMVTGVEISEPVYFTAELEQNDADVTIRLDWAKLSGRTDIDLHVIDPAGEEIFFNHMRSASGGWLDRDDIIGPGPEHVYWENAPEGTYTVKLHYYPGSESRAVTSYRVTVNVEGFTLGTYSGSIGYDQLITICSFTIGSQDAISSYAPPAAVEEKHEVEEHADYPSKHN